MKRIIVFVSVLFHVTSSFDIYDADNHQAVVLHVDRPANWNLAEERKLPSNLLPYPMLDRKFFKLPQTIIPYPRAGRMIVDPDTYDYDFLPDYTWKNYDYTLNAFPDSKAVFGKKSAAIAFPPRIGRTKRSTSDDQDEIENDGEVSQKRQDSMNVRSSLSNRDWSDIEDFEPDYYYRSARAPSGRSKNTFVPRVGKKSYLSALEDVEKRALAFTPRIGRAALIPRIGRNDPRFKVKSRGSFIPRIGRRAALTPRIGRSEVRVSKKRKLQ